MAIPLGLALVSLVFIGQALYEQFIFQSTEDQVSLAFGLPLILVGSLIVTRFHPQIESVEYKDDVASPKNKVHQSPD